MSAYTSFQKAELLTFWRRLFASNTPFVWETEKRFMELKSQHTELVHGRTTSSRFAEEEGKVNAVQMEHTDDKESL